MARETLRSFIGSLVNPLATLIGEKVDRRFGKSASPVRHGAIRGLAFILLLIPISLVALMMVGMTIFSFQMLYSGM
ncbi:hypothetical protein [Herminiimonas aquatilis]|uniref:Uncharacterized protein n=1 Tax=Herminiimonas aquatilis TaxID=345342 RepID=A0ABW2J572_9BURK